MGIFRLFMCLAISSLCISQTTAQTHWKQWQGPFSGNVIGIESSNGRLVCATASGLYESKDQGRHWTPWSGGQSRLPDFYSRPFFELSGDTAYFSGWDGVFRSTDKGLNWDLIFEKKQISDWEYEIPLKLLITPTHKLFLNTNKSVWRSFDGGSNWHKLENAPVSGFGGNICESEGNIFVSKESKIFKSDDGGDSWEEVFQIESEIGNLQTFNGLLLAFINGWPKDTIWRSEDGGATWHMNEAEGLPYLSASGKTAVFKDYWLYLAKDLGAGPSLFLSEDEGRHWEPLWEEPLFQYNVRDICFADSALVLVSRTGNLRGFAHDSLPTKANEGIIGEEVYKVVRQPNALFASTSSGIYRTENEGITWEYVLFCEEDGIFHQENKIFSAGKNMVYKGAFFTYFSKDAGKTWDVLTLPGTLSCLLENFAENDAGIWVISPHNRRLYCWKLGEPQFALHSFQPPNDDKAVRAFATGRCVALLTEKNVLYYSLDLGKHWKTAPNPCVSYYSNLLYADNFRLVFDNYSGVWSFDIAQKEWSELTPVNAVTGDTIRGLHFVRAYQGLLLAGGKGNGLVFSINGDLEKWYPMAPQIPIGDATCLQVENGKFVVGTDGFGLWENAAPEVNWKGDENTFTLLPNPSPSATLYSSAVLASPFAVQVFSANGSFIQDLTLMPGQRWDLGLQNLPSGLYVLSIKTEADAFALKWVKS